MYAPRVHQHMYCTILVGYALLFARVGSNVDELCRLHHRRTAVFSTLPATRLSSILRNPAAPRTKCRRHGGQPPHEPPASEAGLNCAQRRNAAAEVGGGAPRGHLVSARARTAGYGETTPSVKMFQSYCKKNETFLREPASRSIVLSMIVVSNLSSGAGTYVHVTCGRVVVVVPDPRSSAKCTHHQWCVICCSIYTPLPIFYQHILGDHSSASLKKGSRYANTGITAES